MEIKIKLKRLWRKLFFELYWYPKRVRKYHRLWLWSESALKERRRTKRQNHIKNVGLYKAGAVRKPKAKIEMLAKRDGGKKCYYCGAIEHLTVDHFIPVSICKINKPCNWVIACSTCNTNKGNKII